MSVLRDGVLWGLSCLQRRGCSLVGIVDGAGDRAGEPVGFSRDGDRADQPREEPDHERPIVVRDDRDVVGRDGWGDARVERPDR